ncbi:MAG TPA: tRNA (adenosine(37)-N6)-dimethylallyltransferase MiaA [Nitrospinota bacterium]|nr:tRNA (adenosine(37)-N6)-dimethylallyltransferase MiaA [Nitrospinota bacterium]|tara:strand:+ start:9916 stop:10881 length:966 start_codon:yes stop_codon:yes gene_type:complete
MSELAPLLAVLGPTGSGKTEVGIELAKRLGTEIISADSILVYRHFNIGSAKPDQESQKRVVHHMIDVANPDEEFNVSRYRDAAKDIAYKLWSDGKMPLVVGGAWLYVKGLTRQLSFGIKVSVKGQDRLDEIYSTVGQPGAYNMLQRIDSSWTSKVHPNDTFRTQRGLGVYFTSGKTMTEIIKDTKQPAVFDFVLIALSPPRKQLHERIEKRVTAMVRAGLRDEIRELMSMGYNSATKAMQSIGYREIYKELTQNVNPEETERQIAKATKAYAKRQLTWMRNNPEINILNTRLGDDPAKICDRLLSIPIVEELLTRHHVEIT